jgi:hypothetical protein
MNLGRIRKLIDQAILNCSLDLTGLTVLTEAATGYFVLTPLIAALARADYVLALTRDSEYGKAGDIREHTMELARKWNVADKIQVLYDRDDTRIGDADIITNLGFVRPINAEFLKRVKKTAVIPLMWETWEYRHEDLDIEACRRLEIPVLGTNEHHPDLRIFEYIGYVALKLLFEAGIEILTSKIAILGSGEFAEQIKNTLKAVKADVYCILEENRENTDVDKMNRILEQADALVIVEHHKRKRLIGEKGFVNAEELSNLNRHITIIHICGNVDQNSLIKAGLRCWPKRFAPAGHMSVGTDYVGPAPLIKLHAAGLKVGERLAHMHTESAKAFDSEMKVLASCELAQGFKDYHLH